MEVHVVYDGMKVYADHICKLETDVLCCNVCIGRSLHLLIIPACTNGKYMSTCDRLECENCIPKLPNPGRVSTGFGGRTSVSLKPGGRARLNSTATKMSSSGVGALTAVPSVDGGWSAAAEACSSHTLYGQTSAMLHTPTACSGTTTADQRSAARSDV